MRDFQSFLEWSASVRRGPRKVLSYCETRISQAFTDLRPALDGEEGERPAHRCDLARLWCEVRSLPGDLSPRTLACEGVRHGLSLLFDHFAATGRRIAVPRDVYPVYGTIAQAAQLRSVGFTTFPDLDVERTLEGFEAQGVSVFLLPNPLKLHGRPLSPAEFRHIMNWLKRSPERRWILDGVYRFERNYDENAIEALRSEQVIYLDSLSKAWLHKNVFGVAIVPSRDLALWRDSFARQRPDPTKLSLARRLLQDQPDVPKIVNQRLSERRRDAWERLEALRTLMVLPNQGYLIPVAADAVQLLANNDILAIPAKVFGVEKSGWSLLSVLPEGAGS